MKKFVLYNDYAAKNIKDFKDNFGDYLHTIVDEYDELLDELKVANICTRNVYKKSLYNVLSNKNNDNQTLIINAYSFDYLVFKDKFFINNNPHIILDSAILIAKILNIKNIDIYYNHGEKGARLLKEYNKYDKEFLEAIEFHHNDKFSGNNKLLDIIRESDNKN